MREWLLKALARLGWKHPYSVMIVAVASSAFAVYYAVTNIGFMLSRSDMLSAKTSRFHQLYLDYQKDFAPRDDIMILVEGKDEAALQKTVEELAERVRGEPALSGLLYRVDLKHIRGRELLYRDLRDLVNDLDGLTTLESELGVGDAPGGFSLARMISPLSRIAVRGAADKRELTMEDLKRLEILIGDIASALDGKNDYRSPWDPDQAAGAKAEPGTVSPNPSSLDPSQRVPTHSYLVTPRRGPEGGWLYMILMRSAIEDRQGIPAIRKIVSEYEPPAGVTVGLTGEPVIEEDENLASNENMTLISVLALVGIFLIFAILFWEFYRPSFGIVGLLVGLAWSAAYLVLVIGHLNIVSVCFVAILMGLGIDVGIHVIGRYEEERARGLDGESAIVRTYITAGPGILSGMLTTAVSFLTVLLVDFRGIVELGVIAGGGMVLCMTAILVVSPALLRLASRNEPVESWQKRLARHALPEGKPRWLVRYPLPVVAGAAALAAASAFGIPATSFDYNLLHMQPPGTKSTKLAMHLMENMNGSVLFAIASYRDLETLRRKKEEFEYLDVVSKTESLLSLLPEDVEAKRPILQRMQAPVERILHTLARRHPDTPRQMATSLTALQVGLVAGSVATGNREIATTARRIAGQGGRLAARLIAASLDKQAAERLAGVEEKLLKDLETNIGFLASRLNPTDVAIEELPAPMRARFIGISGAYLLQIYPKEDVFERKPQARFVTALRQVDENVTGSPVQLFEFVEYLRQSFEKAGIYAIVAIMLIVLIDFRGAVLVLFALTPLVFGVLTLCGSMAVFGLRFNAANIFVLPLVLGIGVVNGIHLINRFRQDGFSVICKPLLGTSTGTCMLGCALTTIIGFAVLMLNPHRGIQSLGAVMSIGVFTTLVGAVVLLPALIALFLRPEAGQEKPAGTPSEPAEDGREGD